MPDGVEGGQGDREHLIAQYKILWELLESELGRFWLCYNILSVLKVATVASVVAIFRARIDGAQAIDVIFIAVLILLLLCTVSILLNYRAQFVYGLLLQTIRKFERESRELSITRKFLSSASGRFKAKAPEAMDIANIFPIVLLNGGIIVLLYIIVYPIGIQSSDVQGDCLCLFTCGLVQSFSHVHC